MIGIVVPCRVSVEIMSKDVIRFSKTRNRMVELRGKGSLSVFPATIEFCAANPLLISRKKYEPIEPKERSLDHFVKPHDPSQVWHDLSQVWHDLSQVWHDSSQVWHDPSQVWLGYQSWLVELAGRDGLQFGQFEHLVEDLDEAPIRTFAGRADRRPEEEEDRAEKTPSPKPTEEEGTSEIEKGSAPSILPSNADLLVPVHASVEGPTVPVAENPQDHPVPRVILRCCCIA
ncbi:hypothetical protein F2Q69_00060214 [Brassica cretica]|uniref:Uncharacterized protein n=1 Tax=Brassica cretica TaxID=69181 RepID=A0A8S9RDH7_BRACR|nr:hypothetical protein F2Q69_00060214 [Brassica cretica]